MPTATISSEKAKRMSSFEKCHEKKILLFQFEISNFFTLHDKTQYNTINI